MHFKIVICYGNKIDDRKHSTISNQDYIPLKLYKFKYYKIRGKLLKLTHNIYK